MRGKKSFHGCWGIGNDLAHAGAEAAAAAAGSGYHLSD
jgi:hypothetical protein